MTTNGIISMICILGFYGGSLAGVVYKILHSKGM